MLEPNHIILNELPNGPSLTQVAELGKPHTGFGKSQAVVLLDNPKVSGIQHNQLEELQQQHKERDLAYLNGQLRRKKRKSIEMSLTFSHFKKRKLEKVGDRRHFDAHRRVLVDEDKGAR